MKTNEIFGKIRSRNLTVEKAAKLIGISQQSLSAKIKGNRRFYLDEVVSLADRIEMSDEEIVDFFIDRKGLK